MDSTPLVENKGTTLVSSVQPPEKTEWIPLAAMSDQELRDWLHWPGQKDRRLLETACANRKFSGYLKITRTNSPCP